MVNLWSSVGQGMGIESGWLDAWRSWAACAWWSRLGGVAWRSWLGGVGFSKLGGAASLPGSWRRDLIGVVGLGGMVNGCSQAHYVICDNLICYLFIGEKKIGMFLPRPYRRRTRRC